MQGRDLLHSPRTRLGLTIHWHLDHRQQQGALAPVWVDLAVSLPSLDHQDRTMMASGVENSPTRLSLSVSVSVSVSLSLSLSLSLTVHASEAPAKDRRERISTVDPYCGRALAVLIVSTSSSSSVSSCAISASRASSAIQRFPPTSASFENGGGQNQHFEDQRQHLAQGSCLVLTWDEYPRFPDFRPNRGPVSRSRPNREPGIP